MTARSHLNRRDLMLGGTAFAAMISGVANTALKPRLKVLIVDGVNNHDWVQTTKLIRAILEPTGLFDVSVSTPPPTKDAPGWDQWRPDFKAHDVVIQTYNDYGGGPDWPEAVKADFSAYVRGGGGVYVLHAGNNAFPGWAEYNEMIGLGWRPKTYGQAIYIDAHEKPVAIPPGEGDKTNHGARFNALVHRIGEHPVHKGFPRAWMTADLELYRYVRGPAQNLKVLSYVFDPVTAKNWPMEWLVSHGRGRVYVANYGHVWKGDVQPLTLRSVDVQTILIRAVQWLGKRPVTWAVPADFPTAEAISVRPPFAD